MAIKLWLDDIRNPEVQTQEADWIWAKTPEDFKSFIIHFGIPDVVSFDHDLGECETGYDLVKWMVNYMEENCLQLPVNFEYRVHSANPVGAENIRKYLEGYKKFINQEVAA